MTRLALLAAACHQATFIVVESWLFAGLRESLRRRSTHLGKLVSCHLCTGMWIAFGLAALFRPRTVPPSGVVSGRARALSSFAVDSLVIALAGRVLNEVIGVVRREVEVRERRAKLLQAQARAVERPEEAAQPAG